jgi:hypothetical protein
MSDNDKFPHGCVIKDIKQSGPYIYASLYDKNDRVLISATLEYIYQRIEFYGISNDNQD